MWPRAEQALARLTLLAWLGCFALATADVLGATAWSPLQVSRTGPSDYPSVTGFRLGFRERARPLETGDQLLQVGDRELRGAGPIGVSVGFAAFRGADVRIPVRFLRDGRSHEAWIRAANRRVLWPRLIASLLFAAGSFFLLSRATPTPLARSLLWGYLAAAFFFACIFSGGPAEMALSVVVHVVSLAIALALNLRTAFLFPAAHMPESRLLRALPWAFASLALADSSRFYEFPFSRETGAALTGIGGIAYLGVALGALTHNYRIATALERRRMRWFLLGCYLVVAPLGISSVLAAFEPRLDFLPVIALSLAGLLPIFILIGILRCNFLDVDRVISATASYSVLLVAILALLLLAAPALANTLIDRIGMDAELARISVSLTFAAAAIGLHGRYKTRIDTVFFPDRVELEHGLEQMIIQLGACADAREMTRVAGEWLDQLFQPLGCAVYVRAGGRFVPAFLRGLTTMEEFPEDDPLIATLGRRSEPIATEGLAPDEPGLSEMEHFDLAALQTLGVPLVVPVRRDGRLVAFVCLGRKRSGDVYTRTDRTLLTITADKVSSELSRFDQGQMLRAAREHEERLRRYVPGSLAEELDRGREPEMGRAVVSVLFVDLRGYTSYSESRSPEQIFETINRYTGAVSELVREHGGTVVEFNGDGMMAVFGAPRPLDQAAASAARAALAIVDSVPGLGDGSVAERSVAVGVATGPAFVGSVRAVDRWIWTALGNTTNLAARLQTLTAEFDTSLLVDSVTWAAAGLGEREWRRLPGVQVRGRRRPETLFALRAAAPRAAAPGGASAEGDPSAPG